jgi:hypothetical protein
MILSFELTINAMKNSFDVDAFGPGVASVVACIEGHDLNSMLIRVSDLVNRAQRRETLAHLDHIVLYLDVYVHFIQETSILLHAEVLHCMAVHRNKHSGPFHVSGQKSWLDTMTRSTARREQHLGREDIKENNVQSTPLASLN